jgi:hypothetical protein
MRVAEMRFFNAVRWRTRCNRNRARSRSARTSGVGSGDLRDQRPAGELGEHPGVDLVGLRRQGREPSDALGIGDQHIPARELEAVVDEAGTVHRLDGRSHRPAFGGDPPDERAQRTGIGRDRRHQRSRAVIAQHMHVEPLSRQVQSGVQHRVGPPRCWLS